MFFRRYFAISVASLIFSLAGWAHAEGAVSLNETLPEIVAGVTPEGWELFDEVLHFTPENLYEQINGRAELFLSYNVVSLTYAAFDDSNDSSLSINLSVYDMGTALNAFGVFSVERSLDETAVELEGEAYRSGANHYVRKGRYYLQAIATDNGKQAQKASREIAEKVSSRLKDTGEPVWGMSVFPVEGLVHDSLKYFLFDALGLEFMRNTFTALYRSDENLISTFISKRASVEEVQATFQAYSDFGKRYGKSSQKTTEHGTDFLICEMQRGYDVVAKKGTYLVGVTSIPDRVLAMQKAVELHQHCCFQP
jgi:hypothetical protein